MEITQKGNNKIIQFSQGDIRHIAEEITKGYDSFSGHNLIIDISKYESMSLAEVLPLLELSNKHRLNKKSFVVVVKDFDFNDAPEELNIVPTLQEAYDIIEMEDIERDLGF